jgi:hypothetical protein
LLTADAEGSGCLLIAGFAAQALMYLDVEWCHRAPPLPIDES